jgi:hypothetical protein
LAEAYNTLATAAGVATIPIEPDETITRVLDKDAVRAAVAAAVDSMNAAAAVAEPMPSGKTRAETEAETRGAVLKLGVIWLREHGPLKYGKQKLSDVTDAELSKIHAAATSAV